MRSGRFPPDVARMGGLIAEHDLALRPYANVDFQKGLLGGRAGVLSKTDCLLFTTTPPNKNAPYYYIQFSSQLGGSYENWVVAQPVMGWCLTTFKIATYNYEILTEEGLAIVARGSTNYMEKGPSVALFVSGR